MTVPANRPCRADLWGYFQNRNTENSSARGVYTDPIQAQSMSMIRE